jgi:hypothetical protein
MQTTERKVKMTFTKGERAARALAEKNSRLGLPSTPTAARHLANHQRKKNLWQYGKVT